MIPLYYQRDQDGLPRGWIKRMKRKAYVPAVGGTSSDMNFCR